MARPSFDDPTRDSGPIAQVRYLAEADIDVDSPLMGIESIALPQRWLSEREADLVSGARSAQWAYSWGEIAERLGRSRQAVWEKYRLSTNDEDDTPKRAREAKGLK
jgi:predicted transcriptional regulator